jgi:hypothetical protein
MPMNAIKQYNIQACDDLYMELLLFFGPPGLWEAVAQDGIHGVDGVHQAIRDADEGGVDQSWPAAERGLERAERGNRAGRLPGAEGAG